MMIRFDQRHFDVQGTEKVFKKVVHPGQNISLVDKDGIPLKAPISSTLSRLRSQYVLSPRGVPTRRSNHSYSGQLAQAKLHNVVNSLDTSTKPEMMSYSSVHNYHGYFRPCSPISRLSSAPSSQQYPTHRYMPGNLTPKKRSFGSGPPRSVKSMPAKTSASTQRSRLLTSAATTTDQMSRTDFDADKSNESPQGKRLEKEWSALSQCRALKRSSEIVSHRVDRMYFMTGSKLHLQSKYLVEEDDLKHLRELSHARATSQVTRLNKVRKGDVYRPDRSDDGLQLHDGDDRHVNGTEDYYEKLDGQKLNGKNKPPGPPESPIIKQTRSSKSPIAGWEGTEIDSKDPSMANENVYKEILHEDAVNGDTEVEDNPLNEKDNNGDMTVKAEDCDNKQESVANANVDKHEMGEHKKQMEKEEEVIVEGERDKTSNSAKIKDITQTELPNGESVHEQDDNDDNPDMDGDKTVVKSEDYLDNTDLESP